MLHHCAITLYYYTIVQLYIVTLKYLCKYSKYIYLLGENTLSGCVCRCGVLGPCGSVGDPGHTGQCPHCGHNTKHGDTGDDGTDGTPLTRTRCLETR